MSIRERRIFISWVLLGIFAFSPFGVNLCKDVMGLPTAFPEPFVLLFLFFMRKEIKPIKINGPILLRYLLLFFFLLCCSIISDIYPLKHVIANARGWLYMFIVMVYFQRNNNILDGHIAYLCLGIFVGWFLSCLFSISFMISEGEFMGTTGSLLAIPLFFTTTYLVRNYKLLLLGLVLVLLISVFGGVRRTFVVLAITMVLIFLLIKQKKGKLRIYILLFSLLGIVTLAMPYIKNLTNDISPLLYARVFERYSGTVDDNDQIRVDALNEIFNNASNNILPKGFYSSRTDIDGTGAYIDMPISGIIHIFGIPATIALLAYFIIYFIRLFLKYRSTGVPEYLIYSISLLMMFIMLFFEGSFIAVLYATPLTGICLGRAINLSKKNKIYKICQNQG